MVMIPAPPAGCENTGACNSAPTPCATSGVRQWRIDYYFEANGRRVALEVEGGIWTQGRHTRGSGFKRDMEKYNTLTAAGIMLLRTTPKDLLTSQTFELIKKTLLP